jgi:hypothetical protein
MFFDIRPGGDLARLFEAVQDEPSADESEDESDAGFIVFNSTTARVAINLRAAMFIQFLWDAKALHVRVIPSPDDEAGPPSEDENVHVFFDRDPIPVAIGIEPEDDDEDNGRNYLAMVFSQLDTGVEPQQRLYILDEDGEDTFLRAGDISLLTCPLWLLDPKVHQAREPKHL